ncbi:MAG: RnfABCDGE type electron transport complex subunit B [Firmicutes bacterium]|nr:RnfABCDGE type electron transport complex subunit B [Bacillota bacterium]
MDINSILYPVLSIGGLGAIFGLGLGFAAIKFKVEEDPKVPLVRECLPGANCGGCGFAGCDAYAAAVASGSAAPNKCPVGGAAVAEKVAAVMGVEVTETEKMTAFVKCSGDCDKAKTKYEYYGMNDCAMESNLAGGRKTCSYGCLGDGNCVRACQFGALSIENGIAVVDREKCTACGACISACPKGLIELVPYKNNIRVSCNSKDMPKATKDNCSIGCMGCKICEKNCPSDAVHITDFLAKVDYDKCTQCGVCTGKCPTKAIADITKKTAEVKGDDKETA